MVSLPPTVVHTMAIHEYLMSAGVQVCITCWSQVCVLPVIGRFDVVVGAEGLGSVLLQAARKRQLSVQVID